MSGRNYISYGISAILISISLLLPLSGASAYTGAFNITPPASVGPTAITITQYNFDTTSGPFTIQIDGFYVESIVITTSIGMVSSLIIKEYPAGSAQHFDIIAPDEVQDALVNAQINFWADEQIVDGQTTICHNGATQSLPDTAIPGHISHGDTLGPCAGDPDRNMLIAHDHEGEPTVFETATKYKPKIKGDNDTHLWYFNVDRFSSFTFLGGYNSRQQSFLLQGYSALLLLIIISASIIAPVKLRNN